MHACVCGVHVVHGERAPVPMPVLVAVLHVSVCVCVCVCERERVLRTCLPQL